MTTRIHGRDHTIEHEYERVDRGDVAAHVQPYMYTDPDYIIISRTCMDEYSITIGLAGNQGDVVFSRQEEDEAV